jgi:VWFA-related protein
MKSEFLVAVAVAALFAAALSAQPVPSRVEGQKPAPRPTFRANTQTVTVDVIVRDGSGAVVKGLTAADFEVLEDGKPQEIRSFTFEEISEHPGGIETADLLAGAQAQLSADTRPKTSVPALPAGAPAPAAAEAKPMTSEELAGRRLIVLLFDISSMQPEDVQRAVDAATKYVNEKMSPADMVAVATVSSMLDVLTDFTPDRTKVATALAALSYKEGTATPRRPPTPSPPTSRPRRTPHRTEDAAAMDMFNNDAAAR